MRDLSFDDGGAHSHVVVRSKGQTTTSGAHSHIWLVPNDMDVGDSRRLYKGEIIVSMHDGAHVHPLKDDPRTGPSAGHQHGVEFHYARSLTMTESDGAHDHLLLVNRTGYDGIHAHTLIISGVRMTSLMPADIAALMHDESEKVMDREAQVERVTCKSLNVFVDDHLVCKHQNAHSAALCKANRQVLLASGLTASMVTKVTPENIHGAEWLTKTASNMVLKQSGRAVGPRLLGAMSTLVEKNL